VVIATANPVLLEAFNHAAPVHAHQASFHSGNSMMTDPSAAKRSDFISGRA
jgi:hypothetical protein